MKASKQAQKSLESTELSALIRACEGNPSAIYRLEARHPLLPWEETRELFERVAQGDEKARQKIILHNLRLVFSVAKGYLLSGPPWLDLVQAGNEGLILAVDRFDLKRGFQFSTYATQAIRGNIYIVIAQSRVVKTPEKIWSVWIRLREAEKALRSSLGRDPTPQEIRESAQVTQAEFDEARNVGRGITSLDTPIGDDDGMTLGDLLEAPDDDSYGSSEHERYLALIEELCQTLSDKEREAIERRYGLNGHEPQEDSAIASAMGLTIMGAQAQLSRALRKLKHGARGLDGNVCL